MPSNFDSEKRKLLHQKSQQLTTGYGKPNDATGKEGDISFRQIEGSGTVQYLKSNDQWIAVSSSGLMPPQRIMVGGGTSSTTGSSGSGVTDHGLLVGKDDDDHAHYVHISTARTISANHAFTGTPTFTTIDINGGTINGITDLAVVDGGTGVSSSDTWLNSRITTSADGTLNYDATSAVAPNHDNLAGFVADEHIDWTSTSENLLTSGTLASGTQTVTGNVTASGTVSANQLVSTDDLTVADTASIDGTLTLSTGSIIDSSGAITFGNENLSTSGTLASGTQTVTGNVTASGTIEAEHLTSIDDATIADTLSVDGTMTLSTGSIIDSSGAIDFGNENLSTDGNVDIDGDLDVDGVTNLDVVDVDGAVDMASTLTVAGVVDITNTTDSSDDSGDTGALRVEGGASIAKKLYVGTDLDVDGISNLDAVDIDGTVQVNNDTTTMVSSGAINLTAGAASTFSTTGDLKLDSSAEIILSADGNYIKMDDGTTSRFTFQVDNSPELDISGPFILDATSTVTINPEGTFKVKIGTNDTIKSDATTGMLYLKNYNPDNLYDSAHYYINSYADGNHFTSGKADFFQNFSIICKDGTPDSSMAYPS